MTTINAYIIAKHTNDDTLPHLEDVYEERFFISEVEAEQCLEEEFAPTIRKEYGVYCIDMSVLGALGEEIDTTASSLSALDEADEPEEEEVDWVEAFCERHETNPSTNPADYYFNEANLPSDSLIVGAAFVITPKEYFDQTGYLFDGDNAVPPNVLPPGFEESSESFYEYDGNLARGKLALVSLGFVENLNLKI